MKNSLDNYFSLHKILHSLFETLRTRKKFIRRSSQYREKIDIVYKIRKLKG